MVISLANGKSIVANRKAGKIHDMEKQQWRTEAGRIREELAIQQHMTAVTRLLKKV